MGDTVLEAWTRALAGDPVSAFGGVLISNRAIDLETAEKIDEVFYEVLIAPGFEEDALDFLKNKKNRVLLELKEFYRSEKTFKYILNNEMIQHTDYMKK